MEPTCWNLIDLFENKDKMGLDIKYDSDVLPIRDKLITEYQAYKEARKLKYLTPDEITDLWDMEGFPLLFPKIKADLHQMRMVLWCLKVKRAGCFTEQGTGKTPIGIFILGKLLMEKIIEKPLILCPLSLMSETVWFKDLKQFSEFKPVNLRDDDEFEVSGDINFVNYDKLQHWCYKKNKKAESSYNVCNYFEMRKFDAIFFDEASSLKGHSSKRTQAFIKISKYAKYLILASGVPAPNDLLQIWGQMKSIGSVLGDSYNAFANRYGKEISLSTGGSMWKATTQGEFEIRKRIDLVSYFIKASDVLKLPKRFFVTEDIFLHDEHQKIYDKVEADFISAVKGIDEFGNTLEGNAIAQNELSKRMKLLQIINGFTTIEDELGKKTKISLPWNAKLEKLDQDIKKYLSEGPDTNIIIWCRFRWEIETIYKKYKEMASFIYGGMTNKKREEQLTNFLYNDNCRIMVGLGKAAKFGHTWLKANYTIYFSATEDYEDYAQTHDRNYRRGQNREVTEIKYVTKKTLEHKIWYALQTRKKLDTFLKDYICNKYNKN